MKILIWLTNNLRINDNSALIAALQTAKESGGTAHPIFIFDDQHPWPTQGAAAWWLHHSLEALANQFTELGSALSLYKGDPVDILRSLIKTEKITSVYCSLHTEPHEQNQQREVHDQCKQAGVECKRFAGALLFNPQTNLNKQDKPYQVFTPFYRTSTASYLPSKPKRLPGNLSNTVTNNTLNNSLPLTKLKLLPKHQWADAFAHHWQPGEHGANAALQLAIADKISQYSNQRDTPSVDGTSLLSAHLRFGEISPRQIWHDVTTQLEADQCAPFLRQLVWRDFSYALLTHWPKIPTEPFKEKFSTFQWRQRNSQTQTSSFDADLNAWKRGQTGYPIVDAGMRQLWHTGWMHNRVRMIVASFLTKHLRIHWREGAAWFWDTLVDADLANNTAGWQWVAGCGADASPYFRIFNPVLQGEKFDPTGEYVKTWVPELASMPKKYIHAPWLAPQTLLNDVNIVLGENKTYPLPVVDHKHAREEALAAYQHLTSD